MLGHSPKWSPSKHEAGADYLEPHYPEHEQTMTGSKFAA
jgi:hypothetical protein